jgi:hypothetical protein
MPNADGKVQVVIKDKTLWRTQKAMAQLSNCSIIEKIPPKGVSFSDFICTFAMSFRILFVFILQH